MAVHAEDEARLRARRALVEASGDVCDHPHWRDPESALMATKRIVKMASEIGRRLHVLHVSSADEMAYLAHHKRRVSVEVTPHHLEDPRPRVLPTPGSLAQMNPPVRDDAHRQALWQAIRDGVVDVIGSDHAPHTEAKKTSPTQTPPAV